MGNQPSLYTTTAMLKVRNIFPKRYLLLTISVLVLILYLGLKQSVVAQKFAALTPQQGPYDLPLLVGPIEGLTTEWYPAPESSDVPLNTTFLLEQTIPDKGRVEWNGAELVRQSDTSSFAVCRLDRLGVHRISARVFDSDGMLLKQNFSVLNVMNYAVSDIEVQLLKPEAIPIKLDQDTTNDQTVAFFFGTESLSPLTVVDERSYRTSINRSIQFQVLVEPPGVTPLVEWRQDGRGISLGEGLTQSFDQVGKHTVSVGPLDRPQAVEIETYRVKIISPDPSTDAFPEEVPIRYVAETDPPGFEDEVVWMSSTKFGSSRPLLGWGETFDVITSDVYGVTQAGKPIAWTGVIAGNKRLAVDLGACCTNVGTCVDDFNRDACFQLLAGPTFYKGTRCADTDCWRSCGVRGKLCDTGNCGCSSVTGDTFCAQGTGSTNAWIDCCQNPNNNKWFCIEYIDTCTDGNVPTPSGCDGANPTGTAWCGSLSGANTKYVCTDIGATLGAGADTFGQCMASCGGHPFCE